MSVEGFSEKKPAWWLVGPDANARRSTIPGGSCRNLQRVRERFEARQARFAALQARFEASLEALQARFAALQASFEASLEAFQASFAALHARLTAALHARAGAFHARFQRVRARVNARFSRIAPCELRVSEKKPEVGGEEDTPTSAGPRSFQQLAGAGSVFRSAV